MKLKFSNKKLKKISRYVESKMQLNLYFRILIYEHVGCHRYISIEKEFGLIWAIKKEEQNL